MGENRYPVKKGDVIIINYDTPHMFRSLGEGFSAYDFMFKPGFFDTAELDKSQHSSISEKQRQMVLRAVEYLKENFDSPISIGDLAARTFLSKDYFGHLFKDTTGVSVSTFLQKLRIEEACRLLAATDRTVTDIASSCGFGDMKFFYSCFKKLTGTTPARYRGSAKEGNK